MNIIKETPCFLWSLSTIAPKTVLNKKKNHISLINPERWAYGGIEQNIR